MITIDLDSLELVTQQADQILFTKDGEKHLKLLLDLKEKLDQEIANAKILVRESALKLNPNFTSIVGDQVKVTYRPYGSRFAVDPSKVEKLPKDYYKTSVKYLPVPEKIAEFIDQYGAPPDGVIENDRQPQISFKLKEQEADE